VCQKEVNGRIRAKRRPEIRGQQRHPASANAGEICYFECDRVQGEQRPDGEPQSQIAKLQWKSFWESESFKVQPVCVPCKFIKSQ